jgi:hypothetical protein
VNSTVSADAKFLRRVLMVLVALTTISGAVAGLITVQAKANSANADCLMFCE